MPLRLGTAIAGLMLLAGTTAAAEVKVLRRAGTYFNRPGATLANSATMQAYCVSIAEGTESQINGLSVLAGGPGALLGGLIASGKTKNRNAENCMLIGGWRLFALGADERKAFDALPDAGKQALLAELTGAETPRQGTLLRTWHNDYAEMVLWEKGK